MHPNSYWCLTCETFLKPKCQEQHKVVDLRVDKAVIDGLQEEAVAQFYTAITKREEVQEHMKLESTQLLAKLDSLKLKMISNESCLKRLRKTMRNCVEEKAETVSFFSAKKKWKSVISTAKTANAEADKFLSEFQTTVTDDEEKAVSDLSCLNQV